ATVARASGYPDASLISRRRASRGASVIRTGGTPGAPPDRSRRPGGTPFRPRLPGADRDERAGGHIVTGPVPAQRRTRALVHPASKCQSGSSAHTVLVR